ncbi:HAMP domain-containing sensor histidine kinase [Paenibacillus fonticola]|uniref:HAMP domain-containing sensor histidine kinase n=1 Tax=Paenibacillus fonticola TaxID=379896 RepID=UPI0003777A6B|nr:HAMP domain-containing sensor histidine kinase [Paenibacillus fonticola]
MTLNYWAKKWLAIALLLLAVFIGSSFYLLSYSLSSAKESLPNDVIQQLRLAINPLMLYLEQHHDQIGTNEVQAELQQLSVNSGIDLVYVQLDGTVSFSLPTFSSIRQENVNRLLRYDIYSGQRDDGMFQIAFPVIDGESQRQVGNVIYFLPDSKVLSTKSDNRPIFVFIVIVLAILSFVILLMSMNRKIKNHFISPVVQLKHHAEAILKGNYEQKTTYASLNEMGELYAMFDQMRMEIMYLSMQRIKQERDQKELITSISHEIKTPITTVKAYIDSILEGVCSEPDTMLEYVGIMRTHTDKMARLVEDLLLHALQDLGQITVEPCEQYSREILQRILTPIGHYVRTNELTYIEPQEIPNVLISIDAVRIEQVISNLVSNALKHSSPGDSVRIDVKLEAEMLKIIIADTGSGIRPQDMPFIFERYFRGHPVDAAQTGTGLGLSICKTIIEAHGGTIFFTSKHRQGTTFYFTLPLC